MLYLIEILHQTTTSGGSPIAPGGLYLIEILHQTTTVQRTSSPDGSLYLIEILHQTTTRVVYLLPLVGCILSKFYIKPQHALKNDRAGQCCILSKFYIKPQPYRPRRRSTPCCILSKFYIKPQRMSNKEVIRKVVSYRNSTSNHNFTVAHPMAVMLYLIEILHQTTTVSVDNKNSKLLYLIEILHQTTTLRTLLLHTSCCILSKFYIKPQRRRT